MDKELTCPICGEPTSSYMGHARKDGLCRKHAKDLKEEKIFSDENKRLWFDIETGEILNKDFKYKTLPQNGFDKCILCGEHSNGYAYCKKCFKKYSNDDLLYNLNYFENNKQNLLSLDNIEDNKDIEDDDNIKDEEEIEKKDEIELIEEQKNNVIIINQENKSKCITCGKQTEGFLFCPTCYKKYKNKELLFKITNCSSVELLDEDYEGKYTCKDGHIVKSKSERDIDNFLFENDIQHAYEKELPYGAKENEILHPDFFLKDYLGKGKHVYIEHWGYNENNIQYTKTKKFKMPIYEDLKITLVCTYEKSDSGKIDSVLERKLNKNFIKENEINYKED